MSFTIRRSILVVLVSVLVIAAGVFVSQRASAASATPVVYVATGENFPDALGAASAAAVQGGPVLLVRSTSIPVATAGELSRLKPDVIYVAGGSDVVSDSVFNQLKAYAATVTRVEGRTRYETAVEVSKSAFPVTATGGGDVAALTAAVNALTARVSVLEADNTALKATLSGVTRNGDTLRFTGMNLQVVNGLGQTDSKNTLGNLIIGYNTFTSGTPFRGGSHYLVVGDEHQYRSWGGIVAGYQNTASGDWAAVTGGVNNTANGQASSVTGGTGNVASGSEASVAGGAGNTASNFAASAIGGYGNAASGSWSSVTGGLNNTASGSYASVSGGTGNTASGIQASVCGGGANIAIGNYSSVSGGWENTASGGYASVSGGRQNTASGASASVLGGASRTASGLYETYPFCGCTP